MAIVSNTISLLRTHRRHNNIAQQMDTSRPAKPPSKAASDGAVETLPDLIGSDFPRVACQLLRWVALHAHASSDLGQNALECLDSLATLQSFSRRQWELTAAPAGASDANANGNDSASAATQNPILVPVHAGEGLGGAPDPWQWAAACSTGPFLDYLRFAWRLEASQLHQNLALASAAKADAGANLDGIDVGADVADGAAAGASGCSNAAAGGPSKGAASGAHQLAAGEADAHLVEHALMAGLTLTTVAVALARSETFTKDDATNISTNAATDLAIDVEMRSATVSAAVSDAKSAEGMLEDLRYFIERLNQQLPGYAAALEPAAAGEVATDHREEGMETETSNATAAVESWHQALSDTARERAVHLVAALWEAGPTNHGRGWSKDCFERILPQVLETLTYIAFDLPQAVAVSAFISDGLLNRFMDVITRFGIPTHGTAGAATGVGVSSSAVEAGALATASTAAAKEEVAVGIGLGVEVGLTAAAGELAVGVTVGVTVSATDSIAPKDKRPRIEQADDQLSTGTGSSQQSTTLPNGKRVRVATDTSGACAGTNTDKCSGSLVHRIEDTSDDDAEQTLKPLHDPHATLLAASVAAASTALEPVDGGAAESGRGSGGKEATTEAMAELTWCILWAIPCASNPASNGILQANPRTAEVVAMLEALMASLEPGSTAAGHPKPACMAPTSDQVDQLRAFLTLLL